MDFFQALFSLIYIAFAILISPTNGFTSDEDCASLYKTKHFTGETFRVTNGNQFSNLEEEYIASDAVWNITSSVRIAPGCTFTACNESYFNGQCTQFTQDLSRLPEPFTNILSANCTCSKNCKCQDFYNIRKNSCARLYVSAGGCNSCHPLYVDIKQEESESFPDEFATKVTSLMVRQGCQLTVYDEEELEGNEETVKGMIENWTKGPVGSYNCSCDDSKSLNSTPVATQRRPNYPPLINMPDDIDEIKAMIQVQYGRLQGLMSAVRSSEGKRSTKNAYILLLGLTGTGKSSTINFLFDNPNITRSGALECNEKAIHEYSIPVPIDEYGIKNSELRVIDTPGLGDTEGLEPDARLLATLEEYLDSHEDLKTRIPNIILIFHKFYDNRFSAADSNFVRLIRAVDYFRGRLTDDKYSNVVFVFTRFTSEIRSLQRKPDTRLKAFKSVIQTYSNLSQPILMAVAENKAKEESLPMVHGFYKLPNGEFYPKNLIHKITQATQGGRDDIGEAVIRSALKNPDAFKIRKVTFPLVPRNNNKIPKFLGFLSYPHAKEERQKNLQQAQLDAMKQQQQFQKILQQYMWALNRQGEQNKRNAG